MDTFQVCFYKAKENDIVINKKDTADYTLIQGVEQKDKDKPLTYLLKDITFHKEVYRQGVVEFVVEIVLTSTDKNENLQNLEGTKILKNFPIIDLSLGSSKVADTYWVFQTTVRKVDECEETTEDKNENQTQSQIQSQSQPNTTTTYTKIYYTTFKAYSIDKFLTIDKFNKSFTARKLLGSVYSKNNSDTNDSNETERKGIVYEVLNNVKTTAFNMYKNWQPSTSIMNKLNHLISNKKEAVLPYNIQYNESFYDFLVRICNRNGEFLYCEDNELYVGLEFDSTKTATPLTGYSGLEYDETCLNLNDEAVWMDRNPLEEYKSIDSEKIMTTDTVYPSDYLAKISKKDYSVIGDYVMWPSNVFTALKSATECQAISDIVLTAGIETAIPYAYAAAKQSIINKDYENEYFPNGIDDYRPFTNDNLIVDTNFYKTILEGEKNSEQGVVIVTYDGCQSFKLGNKVSLNSNNYIVYRIKGECKPNKDKSLKQTYELLLVPVQQDGSKVYPLPLTDLRVRKSSPQRAFVTSNYDPEKLGRVRVRYFWQTDKDDESPWIRVSAPGASKRAGLMFYHQKDDEVLIDYDEGNIEHPYVSGALYNHTNNLPDSSEPYMHGAYHSLSSANGHHISFSDAESAKFAAELIPIWSMLSKFGFGTDFSAKNTEGMGGGFEIADRNGFYSITGSTHGRNISINSPLGDIVLDAFTGITINAPLGNIELVGKNVRIEARNNLELISGSNIENPYFFKGSWKTTGWKEALKVQGKAMAASLGNGLLEFLGIDLGLYRTLLEVLLRPIGGTMLIKSNRFMLLEAGEGEASIYKTPTDKKTKAKHFFTKSPVELDKSNFATSLETEITKIKSACNKYNGAIDWMDSSKDNKIKETVEKYHQHNDYNTKTPKTAKKDDKELEFVKSMFDSDLKQDDVDSFITKNQTYKDAQPYLSSLLDSIDALKKKIADLTTDLVTLGTSYKEIIDKLSEGVQNDVLEYLKVDDENKQFSFSTGTIPQKIDNIAYRELLVDNLIGFMETNYIYKNVSINKSALNDTVDTKTQTNVKYWDIFDKAALIRTLVDKKETEGMKIGQWLKEEFSKFDGFIDDNVWGSDDKGDIIFSSQEDKSFRITSDGTLYGIRNEIADDLLQKLCDNKNLS